MRTLLFLILIVLSAVPTAAQVQVLIFDDIDSLAGGGGLNPPGAAEQAADALGLSSTVVTTFAAFDSEITTGGPFDIVVFNHINSGGLPMSNLDNMNTFLVGGGAVVFGSWQTMTFVAHPLFVSMGATPVAIQTAVSVNVWDATDDVGRAMANPTAYTDPVGFGTDGIRATPIAPSIAIAGFNTVMPSVGNAAVIVRPDRQAWFVGAFPQLMTGGSCPNSGASFMTAVLMDILGGLGVGVGEISATQLLISPAMLTPGGTFDVDVEVTNGSASPLIVTVDLFFGPAEPTPSLPSSGVASTAVLVPAMGTAMASFTGLLAPAAPDVWRLHALVNSDAAIFECDFSNNTIFDLLCFSAPGGCVPDCGDCNELGDGVTITDALVTAQISAGIIASPTMGQLCKCDVNSIGGITILDALLMAQDSAGLPVVLSCTGGGGGGGALVANAVTSSGTGPISFEFDTCGPPTVNIVFQYSTNGGSTFSTATAAGSSPLASPAVGALTGVSLFDWDVLADIPLAMRPRTVNFVISVTDPGSATTVPLAYPAFMVLGATCGATVDRIIMGSLPISFADNTTGSLDEIVFPCTAAGGGQGHERIYQWSVPMTASYTFSTCAMSMLTDTSMLIRDNDCLTGMDIACMDDTCANFEAEIGGVALTAGQNVFIIIDGWDGAVGPYTMTITSP